jgi:hypothetical protein
MTDLPTQDPGGQDPSELWDQAARRALRLTQSGMWLQLEHSVLRPNDPYPIPDGMTVEAWYSATVSRPSRHAWAIERIHTRGEIIQRVPPNQRGSLEARDRYVSLHNLYRIRIQVTGSPVWFVAAWEPAVKGSGGRVVETLHGVDRCTSPKQASRALHAALRWVRQSVPSGGRKEGQLTGTLTTVQIQAIEDTIVALHDSDPPRSFRQIAEYLNERYPPAEYDRERWNHTTANTWYKRGKERLERNGKEIEGVVNDQLRCW